MNIYFLLQYYLDKQTDHKFVSFWEKRFIGKLGTVFTVLGIIYLVIVFGLSAVVNSYGGFLLAILLMFSIGAVLGYYMVVHFIKFLAKNNERYFTIKTGFNNNTINYDNVVN